LIVREQLDLVSHLNLLHIHEKEAEPLLSVCGERSQAAQVLPDEVGPEVHKDEAPEMLDKGVLEELVALPYIVLLEDLKKGHPNLLKVWHYLTEPRVADKQLLVHTREQEQDHGIERLGVHKLVRKVKALHEVPDLSAHDFKLHFVHPLCLHPLVE
jgi:hypothetical protein